jgi:hypothetical protein
MDIVSIARCQHAIDILDYSLDISTAVSGQCLFDRVEILVEIIDCFNNSRRRMVRGEGTWRDVSWDTTALTSRFVSLLTRI